MLRNEDRESVTKADEKFRDYHTALSHVSFLSLVAYNSKAADDSSGHVLL